MARQVGNQNMPNPNYRDATLPSTINPPPTVPRSAFKPGECMHSHMDPIGEGLTQNKRQFRQSSYLQEKSGPPLKRAIPRQAANGPDYDGAATFGKIGNGVTGDRNPPGKWNSRTGKSTEGITPGNAGRKGLSAIGG